MGIDLKKGGKRKGDSLVEKDGRLMSPFLDWTFKHMFATEESKSNLIGLLNLILMPQVPIVDVTYLNNEVLPVAPEMKGCVFDIICEDENEERYLIEMQNQKAINVKERIIYYTCRMIDRMGLRGGKWNYQDIKKAYTICMMNFTYEANPILRRDIQLYDSTTGELFSDKFNIILLQLPCIKAANICECNMSYEYLLYLLKEMHKSMKTIDELKQEVAATVLPQHTKELFYRIIDTAEVASLSEQDRIRFEAEWKGYLDTMSCLEMAKVEGIEEGIEKGIEKGVSVGRMNEKLDIAKSMKADGIDNAIIAKYTNLTFEEIENL